MRQKKHRVIEINNMLKSLKFSEQEVRRLFHTLDDFGKYRIADGILSVCFLDSGNMCAVHAKFLSDNTLTDVITFPGNQDFGLAGEICVSPDYACSATKRYNTSFSEELTLYLIHGYLHLFGLNDIHEQDIVKMRQGEQECMDLLKSLSLIPTFTMQQ